MLSLLSFLSPHYCGLNKGAVVFFQSVAFEQDVIDTQWICVTWFPPPQNNQARVTIASINSMALICSQMRATNNCKYINSQPEQQRGTLTACSNNGQPQFSTLSFVSKALYSNECQIYLIWLPRIEIQSLFFQLPFFEGTSPSGYHSEENLFRDNRTSHPAGCHSIVDIYGQGLLTVRITHPQAPQVCPAKACIFPSICLACFSGSAWGTSSSICLWFVYARVQGWRQVSERKSFAQVMAW